jgi:hypothetical protein
MLLLLSSGIDYNTLIICYTLDHCVAKEPTI